MGNDLSREDALERARGASREDILEELRAQGVNDLNDLIEVQLQHLRDRDSSVGARSMDDLRCNLLVYTKYVLIDCT